MQPLLIIKVIVGQTIWQSMVKSGHLYEGQEDQLGALGLVTNAVVLWNTIYMQAALDHLQQSQAVQEEDEARLSPLVHRHINMLGHYSFTLASKVRKGQLRPLNLEPVVEFDP